jgi:hypothetical protein
MVTEAASTNQPLPQYPDTWQDNNALAKCHYAGMHMLFLGHVKSNFNMLSKWLNNCSLSSMFGKQVNKYLDAIKKLRINKYYSPHNLSTSAWGTGNWVSENYVFFARTQKFFMTLPSITKSKNIDNIDFMINYRIILRFVSSSHASLSRIMSMQKNVSNMDRYIKIYMDCMVEMDTDILKIIKSNIDYTIDGMSNTDTSEVKDSSFISGNHVQNKNKNKKKGGSNNKQLFPNFVKSNSLGILSVAKFHNEFGPLILNWEGGYAGERKIQEVKPLLGIKRINAEWEKISMKKYYQSQSINNIVESTQQILNPQVKISRETEGILKIYANKSLAENAVTDCEPLSAIIDDEDRVYIAYRHKDKTTRSSLTLIEIIFDDINGSEICNICWMSPIKLGDKLIQMRSLTDVLKVAREYCLLIPQLNNDDGTSYINSYYAIGHKWSERNKNGKFELSILNTTDIFHDWYPCDVEEPTEMNL